MPRYAGRICDALAITSASVFLVWCGLNRLVAGDEGYYLYASHLVMQGKVPYQDFFYPQMPLLPYVYGAWFYLVGESWAAARILSGGIAALLGLLVFVRCKDLGGRSWAILALLLFVACNFVFPWLTVAKTYGLSTLFLFLAYTLCVVSPPRTLSIIFAGVMMGLAVNTRLFFAATIPAFYLHLYFHEKSDGIKRIMHFSLGGALTALPLLYFVVSNFEVFWFNNMGYHLIRSNQDFDDSMHGKLVVLRSVLSLQDAKSFEGFQFLILCMASAGGALACFRNKRYWDLAFPIALILGVVSLIPTPTYIQYFSTLAPFLCVGATRTLARLYETIWWRSKRLEQALAAVLGLTLFYIYLVPFSVDLERYTHSGVGVIGITNPRFAPFRTVRSYDALAPVLGALANQGATVVATWPGYVVGSGMEMLPGLENDFGLSVAGRLSAKEKATFKIITLKDMCDAVRRGEPRFAILTNTQKFPKCLRNALSEASYKNYVRFNDLEVFSR